MPYLIGLTSEPGKVVGLVFEPKIDGRLSALIGSGEPLTPELRAAIPRVLRVSELEGGGVPGIIGWNIGPFVICQRLRDILEELEPGRHEFFPVEIRSFDRGADERKFGIYYLLIGLIGLDAVVVEQTTFTKGFGREGYERSARFDHEKSAVCTLDARIIEGHHFWKLPREFGRTPDHPGRSVSGYFCSDELWSRIKQEHIEGWRVIKKCAVVNG
ncbi:imm11 family protein [Pseudomonas brenneri]|uniref:imm11 family protein n=1 Tax=Pseudomonas brenneri TaxID=129817 RepID=UPI003B9F0AD2